MGHLHNNIRQHQTPKIIEALKNSKKNTVAAQECSSSNVETIEAGFDVNSAK